MKRLGMMCCFLTLFLIQGNSVLGQNSASLQYFNVYSHNASSSDFEEFLLTLESKKSKKNDREFLRYLFTKTHKRFLKKYESNADFRHLTENGSYNCLTGTALYALVLNHTGYEFSIIETNYHIFLIVKSSSGNVLFEATDPEKGFLTDRIQIANRIAKYKENKTGVVESGANYYHYSFRLFNEVNLDQMQGLLFYNEAIEAFNVRDLPTAINYLDKAIALYNSPRIQEFSRIVLLTVMQTKMDLRVKESCLRKIQSIQKQKIPAITSSASEINFN
jgi:hypothetical protein